MGKWVNMGKPCYSSHEYIPKRVYQHYRARLGQNYYRASSQERSSAFKAAWNDYKNEKRK